MLRNVLSALVTLLALVVALPSFASPRPWRLDELPETLRPWADWVLDHNPSWRCPVVDGQRACLWPGTLQLDVTGQQGRFEVRVEADSEAWLSLPGGADAWPQQVLVNGVAVPVAASGGVPTVQVPAGNSLVVGQLAWSRPPESVPVPPAIALVTLSLDGQPVVFPRREAGGNLWLRAREAPTDAEQDRLDLQVFRLLTDTVPATLVTHLRFQVSGGARELALGTTLPAGFVAHSVVSGLPTQIAANGELRIQLRPGQWDVQLHAHAMDRSDSIEFEATSDVWPAEELWSFAARPELRSARVVGLTGVDPERTQLPAEWRMYPAWRLQRGESFVLEEQRRGDPEPAPDTVDVSRRMWLATTGRGLTVRDTVNGSLSVGARLEALAPAELGRVDVNGAGRVITTLDGATGVEVREGHLNLLADLAYDDVSSLPAVGWNRDARSLSVELNLPPGWQLLTASGADSVSGAWARRWTLMDLFLLLLTVLAVRQVAGNRVAALALVSLGLAWHERGSMQSVWIVFVAVHVLAERLAAFRAAVLLRGMRWALAGVLVVGAVLFVGTETRVGLFPQLARNGADPMTPSYGSGDERSRSVFRGLATDAAAPPMEPAPIWEAEAPGAFDEPKDWAEDGDGFEQLAQAPAARMQVATISASGESADMTTRGAGLAELLGGSVAYRQSAQADPAEVVQTGPGVPEWSWRRAHLSWNGPVRAGDEIRLWLLPPWAGAVVSVVRSLGLLGLALLLAALVWKGRKGAGRTPVRTPVGVVSALIVCGIAAPLGAQVIPSDSMLHALEQRLLRGPECGDACVDIVHLQVFADAAGLRMELEVHALDDGAVRLPGPAAAWTPTTVLVNGIASHALRTNADGVLELRVADGVQRVSVAGPARDVVALRLPQPVRAMTVTTDGWNVAGWRPDQPPPRTFELTRSTPIPAGEVPGTDDTNARVALPAWVELRRELDIGVPWAVHSELVRMGPGGSPVVLAIPLLPGESVTTPGIAVEGGIATLTLEADQGSIRWDSILTETDSLVLRAPTDASWTEVWTLACSPVFHCRHEGLVPIAHMGTVADRRAWKPVWRPWPGEEVALHFERPVAAEGAAATIDRATMNVSGGRALRDVTLTLDIRSSQGGEHAIGLPADAQVQDFRMDGISVPARPVDGSVRFTVEPGAHQVSLAWREETAQAFVQRTPQVTLDTATVNATVEFVLPSNRWVLWAGGTRWGPVVTIWQYVIALAIGAALIARFAPVPMNTLSWFVLGLGTSQAHPFALLSVVLWLILLGLRGKRGDRSLNAHNLLQLVLVVATIPAFLSLMFAIEQGLRLYPPDMGVAGAGSYGQTLRWYIDRTEGSLPVGWVLSVPLWVWHVLMLSWALWVAWRFVGWVRWGWAQFGVGGLWKSLPRPPKVVVTDVPTATESVTEPEPPVDTTPTAPR